MTHKCFWCKPVFRMTEGADHSGMDYFMRCPKCQTRTACHVEGVRLTPKIKKMLRREWREGRIETP